MQKLVWKDCLWLFFYSYIECELENWNMNRYIIFHTKHSWKAASSHVVLRRYFDIIAHRNWTKAFLTLKFIFYLWCYIEKIYFINKRLVGYDRVFLTLMRNFKTVAIKENIFPKYYAFASFFKLAAKRGFLDTTDSSLRISAISSCRNKENSIS